MSSPTKAKKITELPENTTVSNEDIFVTGMGGTSELGKTKWSKILAKLRSVLFANNLTTNTEGYGMDARQGPVIAQKISNVETAINQLNTNLQMEDVSISPIEGVAIYFCIKIPAIKIMFISGQIQRGKTGIFPIAELPVTAKFFSYAPVNAYDGVSGEVYVYKTSDILAVAISSSEGDGKFQIIIPYL